MADMTNPDPRWSEWVERACAAVGVDPALVDIPAVHLLAKHVAHEVERPLAPVSTFIVGLALGQRLGAGVAVDAEERTRLEQLIPLSY